MAQPRQRSLKNVKNLFDRAGLGALYLPVVVALGAVLVVFVIVALVKFWPCSASATETFELSEQVSPEKETVSEGTSKVFVDVTGSVLFPGVYELDDGSRVIDAITKAGGATAEAHTASVNLARILLDGEQIHIPSNEEMTQAADCPSLGGNPVGITSLVNINSATVEQLSTLDGIGEATAAKIIADRQSGGPFENIEDIQRVSGIGEKKYEAIKGSICV